MLTSAGLYRCFSRSIAWLALVEVFDLIDTLSVGHKSAEQERKLPYWPTPVSSHCSVHVAVVIKRFPQWQHHSWKRQVRHSLLEVRRILFFSPKKNTLSAPTVEIQIYLWIGRQTFLIAAKNFLFFHNNMASYGREVDPAFFDEKPVQIVQLNSLVIKLDSVLFRFLNLLNRHVWQLLACRWLCRSSSSARSSEPSANTHKVLFVASWRMDV